MGWQAKGHLTAIYALFAGGSEELAAKSGIQRTNLSSINTGKRNLGEDVARRILAVQEVKARGLTIFDLGAPEAAAETEEELSVLDHLRLLQDESERLANTLTILAKKQRPALRDQLLRVLAGDPP